MIIASDLDRTLVYSQRAIKNLGGTLSSHLKPVEQKDNHWTAFMTNRAFFDLKILTQNCLFIPITTRTTEQFNRFTIFNKEISLPYAITTNGAVILSHGRPMEDWKEYIVQGMREDTVSLEELQSWLKKEGVRLQGQIKKAGSLFFYYILEILPSLSEREIMSAIAESAGWRTSLQGRKLYFIPKIISKGAALEFICRQTGSKALAGAGDSDLDWDFLKYCEYRFVPRHAELKSVSEINGLTVTRQFGVSAGEEILQEFLKLLNFFK